MYNLPMFLYVHIHARLLHGTDSKQETGREKAGKREAEREKRACMWCKNQRVLPLEPNVKASISQPV